MLCSGHEARAQATIMDTKCDHCEQSAVANYQRIWVRYPVVSGGYGERAEADEMNDNDMPTDENNIHVCEAHEEQLLAGEI